MLLHDKICKRQSMAVSGQAKIMDSLEIIEIETSGKIKWSLRGIYYERWCRTGEDLRDWEDWKAVLEIHITETWKN